VRYQCIDRRRISYPVRLMCRSLRVSSSGYYAWRVRAESDRTVYDRELTRAIRRWASDTTFIWTGQGWLYLAVVMDLYSRRIVGWSMSRRNSRHLVLNALSMALGQRQVKGELIHHSDRGAQYLSDDFQALLKKHGISCSLSGAGSCYDNAAVESFFASLKRERVKRRKYRTRDQARTDVFDYIERFYNRQRRHSYVGNISPVEFEERTIWA